MVINNFIHSVPCALTIIISDGNRNGLYIIISYYYMVANLKGPSARGDRIWIGVGK